MIMNWRIYIALSSNEVLGKPVHMYRLVRAAYTRIYKDCGSTMQRVDLENYYESQIVQTQIKCHILQHFILVFTVCLNLIIIAKPKHIHFIWCAQLLSPVCALYLFYVNLYWNKLYVLRLWINTFSPYPQFLFFPPQIYRKIKKWEKQEYTLRIELYSPL